jgi:hypothetical protein
MLPRIIPLSRKVTVPADGEFVEDMVAESEEVVPAASVSRTRDATVGAVSVEAALMDSLKEVDVLLA